MERHCSDCGSSGGCDCAASYAWSTQLHLDEQLKKQQQMQKMQSTVTWHKYPDEKPKCDIPLLGWDGKKVLQVEYRDFGSHTTDQDFVCNDPGECDHYGNMVDKPMYWAYMPPPPVY